MIDPPEEKIPIYTYALGDRGKVEHIASFQNANDALMAIARLKQGDPCFVRRSDGSFTFAKLLSRTRGQDAQLELQVNINGATKTIPLTESARYVRPLRSMVHHDGSESKNIHRRDTASNKNSGGGRRGGLQRSASSHARLPSDHPSSRHSVDLHHESKQTPRASHTNYKRQSDHHASCPSVKPRRRATYQADEPPSKMNLARPTTTTMASTTSVKPRRRETYQADGPPSKMDLARPTATTMASTTSIKPRRRATYQADKPPSNVLVSYKVENGFGSYKLENVTARYKLEKTRQVEP